MSAPVIQPQNGVERLGAFLFPIRGIPGILFLVVLVAPFGPMAGDRLLNWTLGPALLFFGEGMRVLSRRYIGRSSSTRTAKVSHLVTGGPYRFVRNPIYIGNLGILAGFGAMAGLWWAVAFFVPFCFVMYYFIASFESRIVVTNYPEEGGAYVASVPAWLPKLTPGPVTPSDSVPWSEVLRREGNTIVGILVGVAFLLCREMGWIGRFVG